MNDSNDGNNRKATVGKFETSLATMIEQMMRSTAFGKITAVNVAIGIRSDGGKEFLDYSIAPTENGTAWSELLQGLRAWGIKDIQLFIADGLVGLQSAIEANYPQAKFQRCWVHAERNLLGYVRKNERREIITDFKAVRQAENLQDAKERLAAFSAKWESGYKRRIKNLVQMDDLFTFFSFPTAIRQTIYSTNLIESFNKSLRWSDVKSSSQQTP